MSFDYRGAIAVVTGASSGIGRQLAIDLVARGARVIGVARRAELLRDLPGHEACDLHDVDGWVETLRRIGPVDLLVNAAGIGGDDLDEVLTVNFLAPAHGTLAVLPAMLERRRGAVVNVSSDEARAPQPGSAAYAASKGALSAFTESLAHEHAGSGVHLHVLYPGWVPTPMGLGALGGGMREPPKAVRRTAEQVSKLTLDSIGGRNFEINAARLATLAPVARALVPPLYRRSMRPR